MTPEGRETLVAGAAKLGVHLTPEQVEQFAELYDLLVAGNARLNLTALKTEQDIILKHFVDSLSCLRSDAFLYAEQRGQRVLDLGTGGGFPSLPLAIALPALRLTPVDATRKKIEFVQQTAQALGLCQVEPVVGRAETLGRETAHREQYDVVVARAVSALPVLVELALPLLKLEGVLVAQKGPLQPDELRAGRRAAGELGGQISKVDSFELPMLGDARTLLTVQKMRRTPEQYPRRDGMPSQQPLFWKPKGQN